MPFTTPDWRLVVPVKALGLAKRRLGPLAADQRRALAWAFARDTLTTAAAVVGADAVAVVTDDPQVSNWARELGAAVVGDLGDGLDAAVRAGEEHWTTAVPRAALLADLPALTAEDLRAGLRECARHEQAAVADREGTGTVLLTAAATHPLDPSFGVGSARAHAHRGAVLTPDLPRLRRDVDDLRALREAIGLGLAPHSAAVVASLAWVMHS